jgi:hypothetical protein
VTAPVATIIIPIGVYHVQLAHRALASAAAQTVPVVVLPITDDQGMGAGFARNRGIEQADTDFLVFLDSDDLLMPNFVERCYAVYQQVNRYIFTDFIDDSGVRHNAPDCAFTYRPGDPISADPMANAHAVTAFVPTEWARRVDGFDETLPGGEDSEFYIHLAVEGLCGTRLPEALFVYTNAPEGRSKRFRADGLHDYQRLIAERYGGKTMGCCAEPAKPKPELDRAAPGLVLARPRWGGNRQERGNVTGFLYPRVDKSAVIEVDPRDAAARPDLWDVIARPQPVQIPMSAPVVPQPAPVMIPTPDIAALAQRALQIKPPAPQPPLPPPPAPIVPAMPNVERVTRLAQRASQNIGGKNPTEPYFEMGHGEISLMPSREHWHTDPTTGAEYVVPDELREFPRADTPAMQKVIEISERIYGAALGLPDSLEFKFVNPSTVRRTNDPVFVFPDKDYSSYTDVRRLVELSGFEVFKRSEFIYTNQRPIILSPEPPWMAASYEREAIWWTLEYGGEYEPDTFPWRGEVWASDPTWAKAHGAKLVIMGSHPDLNPYPGRPARYVHDVTMLAYMTPRRERIKQQLADLAWPAEIYPGYGDERHEQITTSRLMLHVHQRDDTHAIAPQRIALAAAYQLPLICESVPDVGDYGRWIPFVSYDNLNAEVRSQLAMYSEGIPQARAERLHHWLCEEHTFRMSVEQALKS